ncbi:MAG: 3-methyl-2-oxobutanoate dehydrogenase subunit VorB [Defluviitaleaceae bacterium]|nr:3-methyl-2-oxobutanoate dehydrogenase subunit VorB [Defluviitaleaceae bacterium]
MKILMKGNEAICEAAIRAGCVGFFGYPITPQNEVPEYMSTKMAESGGTFVQAESEVAAINMVYGASAAGARVMTSSSSPGIALKQEGISYLAAADLPCLIVSVSRSGPGLAGILPSQSDYFQATKGGGNGDYYMPVFAPNSVQEATDFVQKSFEVAERYRTPVMVLIDGLLGQMMEPVEFSAPNIPQFDKSWAVGPRNGRERNIRNSLDLSPESLEQTNIRRFKRYDEIIANETRVESTVQDGDEVVVVAYGTSARIAVNAIEELGAAGIKAGLIRPITLWPFPNAAFQNLPASVKHVVVVELSQGQMVFDVKLAVAGKLPVHFYGRNGGMIFESPEIAREVTKIVRGE